MHTLPAPECSGAGTLPKETTTMENRKIARLATIARIAERSAKNAMLRASNAEVCDAFDAFADDLSRSEYAGRGHAPDADEVTDNG